jgi:hypothetical protein
MDIPAIRDLISPEQIEEIIESVTEYLTFTLRGYAPEEDSFPTLNDVIKDGLEQLDEFEQYYEQVSLIVKKTLGGIVEIEYDVTGPATISYGMWDCDIDGPWFVVEGKRLPTSKFTDDALREMIS